jgi:hypothetical protein
MAMWSKKPAKMLEKPHVGAYSHSQALHVVVITKQTYARGITVTLRRFFSCTSYLKRGYTWGGVKNIQ